MPERPERRFSGTRSMIMAVQLQNHNGVDEDTEGLNKTGLCGLLTFCGGSGTGGGAGAGFVGEKTTLDSVHQHSAETAGRCLTEPEGFLKDPGKNAGNLPVIDGDDKKRDEKVADSHDGNNGIQYLHRGIFPKDDDSGNDDQKNARVKGRDRKGICEGRGHGIADDLADATPADQAGNSEEHGDQYITLFPSKSFFDQMMDIVGGPAAVAAVERILFLMELSQGGFNEGGGGTDDGGNPHPEYSSRAAGGNCQPRHPPGCPCPLL